MKKHLGVAVVCLFLMLAFVLSGCDSNYKWGKDITEGIPLPQDMKAVSTNGDENYAAAYFEGVSSEAAAEYASLLESECGIEFTNDNYPRSAIHGERIIVLHYNVTEMKLSVTVAAKGNNDNTSSGDTK